MYKDELTNSVYKTDHCTVNVEHMYQCFICVTNIYIMSRYVVYEVMKPRERLV